MQTGNVRGKTNEQGLIIHVRVVCFSINPFSTFETSKYTNRQRTNLVLSVETLLAQLNLT